MHQTGHSIVAHWDKAYDEEGLIRWLSEMRDRLGEASVNLGFVFMSPAFFSKAESVLELVRVHGRVPLLAGCSSTGLIAGPQELEQDSGLVVGLYSLPGAELRATYFTQEQVEEAAEPGYWHEQTGISPERTNGWLALIDPFHLNADTWLGQWNDAYPGVPVLGGLASGDFTEQHTQVYLNGTVYEQGGVAISFGGEVELQSVISQGCTPIGETWTITKVDGNLIHDIGNRPAYEVLLETISQLSRADQAKARGNLFVGLVINEYLEEFHRGDFLIRNLLGADPARGILAVGALPRAGQTLQFQRRDPDGATEDLVQLLRKARERVGAAPIYGACLCSCNGRGAGLFGRGDHDASCVTEQLGPVGLTGFFCNGEIGPVGQRNFLHGYTASLALFLPRKK